MAQRALTPGNAAYCSECAAETTPESLLRGADRGMYAIKRGSVASV